MHATQQHIYHMPDIYTSIAMFASPPICRGYSVPVTLPLTPDLFTSSVNTVSPYAHTSHTLALLLCVALRPSSLHLPPTPRPVPSHQPRDPLVPSHKHYDSHPTLKPPHNHTIALQPPDTNAIARTSTP